ncbi:MAG TPA: hypothetical protein DCY79_15705 [Planctomycetaceae bacterium]|nr:hypothetical protein [Blastopirellula sp.]HAY81249.1 hypothetical protein [Planctomycetaceae bacterium]
MKEYFFLFVGGGVLLSIVGLGIWQVMKACYVVYQDWMLGKELDELEADHAIAVAERRVADAARLDNGCQHVFQWSGGADPVRICSKCGLQEQRPEGDCDHVWHQGGGAVPNAYCILCHAELHGARVGVAQAS